MAASAMGARTASVVMCSVMDWIWAVAAWTATAVDSGASFFEQPETKASKKASERPANCEREPSEKRLAKSVWRKALSEKLLAKNERATSKKRARGERE